MDVLFAILFDHALYVESALLGRIVPFLLGASSARIELPSAPDEGKRALGRPKSAASGMEKLLLPVMIWGVQEEEFPYASLEACLIVVRTQNPVQHGATEESAGTSIRSALDEVIRWFDSFCRHIWVSTAQQECRGGREGRTKRVSLHCDGSSHFCVCRYGRQL